MSQKLTEGFDLCTENNKIEIIEYTNFIGRGKKKI